MLTFVAYTISSWEADVKYELAYMVCAHCSIEYSVVNPIVQSASC